MLTGESACGCGAYVGVIQALALRESCAGGWKCSVADWPPAQLLGCRCYLLAVAPRRRCPQCSTKPRQIRAHVLSQCS